MKNTGIQITCRIPISEMDANGTVYDLNSYREKLRDTMVGSPIIVNDGKNCIGVVTNINVFDDIYEVEGTLFAGGTTEIAHDGDELLDKGTETVVDRICSFWFGTYWCKPEQ